jgi:PilZ domain
MAHNHPGPTSHDAPKPRLARAALRIKAFLEDHRGRRRVLITDYSQYGLSLARVAGVELDGRVTVELRSGDRLPMRVVWVRGAEAGVRFLGPIVAGHPVMRLLDEAKRHLE